MGFNLGGTLVHGIVKHDSSVRNEIIFKNCKPGTSVDGSGDAVQVAHNDEAATLSEVYIKKKTITINETLVGSFRFYFEIKTVPTYNAYGKIYKNGIAVGTERSGGDAYTPFNEDLSMTINSGDTIELWGRTATGAGGCFLRYFKILYNISPIPSYSIS